MFAAAGLAALAGVGGFVAAAPARPEATTVRLSAASHGKLRFSVRTLHARHGRITLVMRNPRSAGIPHAIAVRGRRGRTARPGGTSRVTVRLRRGTYTFYCPVPGHRAGGMRGRLIVR